MKLANRLLGCFLCLILANLFKSCLTRSPCLTVQTRVRSVVNYIINSMAKFFVLLLSRLLSREDFKGKKKEKDESVCDPSKRFLYLRRDKESRLGPERFGCLS